MTKIGGPENHQDHQANNQPKRAKFLPGDQLLRNIVQPVKVKSGNKKEC